MPIYEYICEDCQTHFEKIVLNKTQEIACPKCAGNRNAIQLSVFSTANGQATGLRPSHPAGPLAEAAVVAAADAAATDLWMSPYPMLISHSSLLLFVTGAAILLLIPGPAVTYVVSRSIGHGRAAGLVSVMGIVTGTLCHVLQRLWDFRAAGFFGGGVSVRKVSRRSLSDLSWNQDAAAQYEQLVEAEAGETRLIRIYGQGLLVNLLNPKTALFFLAFLPPICGPNARTCHAPNLATRNLVWR